MEFNIQLPLPIPNGALPYLAYDEYRQREQVYVTDSISIDELIIMNYMVRHTTDPMYEDENGLVYFPGERDRSLNLAVADDKAKKFVWSMIDAVYQNELKKMCFGGFGRDDVVANRMTGKAMFQGVQTFEDLPEVEFDVRLRMNYRCIASIAEAVFCFDVPADIQHLLDRMEHHFEERHLFRIHGSLVPMANHSGLFKEVFDTLTKVIPVQDFHDILLELRARFPDYMLHWRTMVAGNSLLNETFTFNGGTSYIIPNNVPNQKKLSRDQKTMLSHLRIPFANHNSTLDPHELILIEPLQLLLFLRNRPAHRLEHYAKFLLANPEQDFNSLGSERVSHGRFPLILVFLQWELHHRGHLWRIPALSMFWGT